MTDGDFGGDGGDADSSDGGAFDLNNNGTAADEFLLFAAITESNRTKRSSSGGPAKRSGCLLPAAAIAILALGILVI